MRPKPGKGPADNLSLSRNTAARAGKQKLKWLALLIMAAALSGCQTAQPDDSLRDGPLELPVIAPFGMTQL